MLGTLKSAIWLFRMMPVFVTSWHPKYEFRDLRNKKEKREELKESNQHYDS